MPYAQVRELDLQVWEGEALLQRFVRHFDAGITEELSSKVSLARGTKRLLASAKLAGGEERSWAVELDPGEDATVVVSPKGP